MFTVTLKRTMGILLEQIKGYFKSTPKEILEKEYKEWAYLNEIGPDVLEHITSIKNIAVIEYSYSSYSAISENAYPLKTNATENIDSNSQFCMVA